MGKTNKPLPSSVCANLAPNFGWTILTKTNEGNLPLSADGEETTIELDLATVPTTGRPEEVNKEEDVETKDKHIGNRDTSELTSTGRVKIVQDIPLSELDTAPMGTARNEDTQTN